MEILKKLHLIVVFVLLGPLAIYAQDGSGIKGHVIDTNGVQIESGDVVVLSPDDSTVIKGIHFWDGSFELYGILETEVLIKITASSYQDYYQRTILKPKEGSVLDLGTIRLKESIQSLNEVDAVYTRPMFEREIGKLVVNVDGTILSERGTILELLKSAPNVIVKSSGDVIVVGKGNAIIYIDGQRLGSLDMLSSISANIVDRIEIIENPSARYDAEGNAVIEIITKKGALNGYEVNLGLRGMKRTYETAAYWAGFNYRKNWFSMYLFAGQYTGTLREEEEYYRKVFGNPMIEMKNKIGNDNDHRFDTWVYLDTDYRLDSINTLFTSYSFTREKTVSRSVNSNEIFEDEIYIGDLSSNTLSSPEKWMHSASAGYNRVLDTVGSNLRITGQYTNFEIGNLSTIEQVSTFGSSIEKSFLSENYNHINFFSGQLDFEKKFNKTLNLN